MTESRRLVTTAEVAELVRVPASTVRYWRHINSGPKGFRVGRRVVYWLEDVEAWLADCAHAEP
jgi:predicted DNA-binding transcriptional regulator AlpA